MAQSRKSRSSAPRSGIIGKTLAAYFTKINVEGDINGRKINFISYDDSYNPAKTVELTRKLVEEDKVLLMLASIGTTTSAAGIPCSANHGRLAQSGTNQKPEADRINPLLGLAGRGEQVGPDVRNGSCVTSTAGPHGDAQLYER